MAQVIKIKRSSSTATPGSLNQGELAYSSNSDKLFIGNPGTGDVTEIGGKRFMDMLKGTVVAGSLIVGNGATSGGFIEFREDTDNGTNYVRLQAPDSVTTNLVLKLPSADGSSGQFLKTDGSGNLVFDNVPDGTITLSDGTNTDTYTSGNTLTFTGGTGLTSLVGDDQVTFSITAGGVSATELATGAVTTTKLGAGAVTNAKLGADAVDGTKIADDAINSEHIVDGAVDNVHLANSSVTVTAGDGLGGGGTVALGSSITVSANVDDSTLEIATDTMRVKDAGITNAKLANSSVTVTAGDGLSGGGAVALGSSVSLAVGVDDSSIETNADVLRVKALGVTNAMLAGSIENAKLSNSSVTVTAGNGLTGGGAVSLGGSVSLAVGVDNSSIEISGDALQVKASGITNTMLAGNITNGKLANSSLTIGSTNISLGATSATLAGLTSVTSTDFIGDLSRAAASGTDAAGTSLTIKGGAGTGAGAGGSIVFQVADGGASGATVNTHTTALTIADDKTMTAAGNVVISGNLTVSGTTTTVSSETVTIADNILVLNSNYSGSTPTENGGLEVERGSLDNATLVWNETTDKWQVGIGSTVYNLLTNNNFETEITSIDGGSF